MIKTMSIPRWQCQLLTAVVMVLALPSDGFRSIQPSHNRASGFRIRQPRIEIPSSSSSTPLYQPQTTTTITTTTMTATTTKQHPQSTHKKRKLSALTMLTTFLASALITSTTHIPPTPTATAITTTDTTTVASIANTLHNTQLNTVSKNQPSNHFDDSNDNNRNRDTPFIQNRMLHYGVYCGPGPADAFSGVPAVDSVDRVCQTHDQQYHMCLSDLQSDPTSLVSRLPLPAFINQFVAIRGFLPPPLTHAMHTMFPTYLACVQSADRGLVAGLHAVEDGGLVPAWWADTRQAPKNAEGVRGYHEACVLGLPSVDRSAGLRLGSIIHGVAVQVGRLWTVEGALAAPYPGPLAPAETHTDKDKDTDMDTDTDTDTDTTKTSGGLCLLSSRGVFLSGALDLFTTNLAADDASASETSPTSSPTTLVTADASASDNIQSYPKAAPTHTHTPTPTRASTPPRDMGLRPHLTPATPEPGSTSSPDPFLFMRPFSSPYDGPTHQLSTLMFFRD